MFARQAHSAHEADAEQLIELHLDRVQGAAGSDDRTLADVLRQRDKRRRLKFDASQVNIYLIDMFEALFPGSRYVLTVRRPGDWLRSMVDDSLRRDVSATWHRFRDYRFRQHQGFTSGDEPLRQKDLYPLSGYLNYWREAVELPFARIPSERLLVIPTHQLTERADEIAAFSGMSGLTVPQGATRKFVNPERFGVVESLDPDYLSSRIAAICEPVIKERGLNLD